VATLMVDCAATGEEKEREGKRKTEREGRGRRKKEPPGWGSPQCPFRASAFIAFISQVVCMEGGPFLGRVVVGWIRTACMCFVTLTAVLEVGQSVHTTRVTLDPATRVPFGSLAGRKGGGKRGEQEKTRDWAAIWSSRQWGLVGQLSAWDRDRKGHTLVVNRDRTGQGRGGERGGEGDRTNDKDQETWR